MTIILATLMLLAGVLAPSIMDFVRDARFVKVKEDCEAIGVSLSRMLVDTGPCIRLDGRLPCSRNNRVNLLVSEGNAIRTRGLGAQLFDYGSYSYEANYTRMSSRESISYSQRIVATNMTWINATHLGGATAFTSEIKSDIDLRSAAEKHAADFRELLVKAEIDSPEIVISRISNAKEVKGSMTSCSEVILPQSGIVKCRMNPGIRMLWMAYRPKAAVNDRAVDLLKNVQWSGESLNAFMFQVETPKARYIFLVPEACGNLALFSVSDRQSSFIVESKLERQMLVKRKTIGWAYESENSLVVDIMENHLVQNLPRGRIENAYLYPDVMRLSYSSSIGMGWRGAYLSAIGPDPWGNRYMVNSIFFFDDELRWPYNSMCLSAGPDGVVETPFARAGVRREGDDFTYVISGGSR
ncbi:MAG: hypothetical protein A2568_02065 [Candidatus Yanofskybacteria bacterium RIFOXYD1_FULL_44_17]|nr:MAG: hypothetical protein A2568_02065 [Candidatus Yanofskybacteria bacterium RIFOXYD1_FULL_44_17]